MIVDPDHEALLPLIDAYSKLGDVVLASNWVGDNRGGCSAAGPEGCRD